jgi:hypothetical protein
MSQNIPLCKKKYTCKECEIETNNKKDYNKHIMTSKHKDRTIINNLEQEIPKKNIYKCNNCNKIYKARNSLWYHEQRCIKPHTSSQNIVFQVYEKNPIISDSSSNEIKVLTNLVIEVMKTNTELQKQNQEFQKQIIDVCQKIQPANSTITNSNNTNTNSHNKTFNLQFFLNEQCKDAMNIKDFIQSIKIEMSDLERVGKEGYVEGISKIIIEKLKATDIYKRPLHCSDAKRETMYIKEDDVWNKDESLNNEKMIKFVKDVDNKNYDFLMAYTKEFPEVYDQNSNLHTPYLHMVIQSTREPEGVKKVIKKIIKEVLINKEKEN